MAKKAQILKNNSIKFWEWWEWSNDAINRTLEGWIYKIEKQKFRNDNENYIAYFICSDGTYKVFILNAVLKNAIKNLKEINKLNGEEDNLLNILIRITYKGPIETKIGKMKFYDIEAEYGKKVNMELLFAKPPLKWKFNPNKTLPSTNNIKEQEDILEVNDTDDIEL